MENKLESLSTIIQKDKRIADLWRRDTEAFIKLLNKRKAELKHGQWGKYLEGIGMPRTTAFRLLSEVKDASTISNVPNGTNGKIKQEERPQLSQAVYSSLCKQHGQDVVRDIISKLDADSMREPNAKKRFGANKVRLAKEASIQIAEKIGLSFNDFTTVLSAVNRTHFDKQGKELKRNFKL